VRGPGGRIPKGRGDARDLCFGHEIRAGLSDDEIAVKDRIVRTGDAAAADRAVRLTNRAAGKSAAPNIAAEDSLVMTSEESGCITRTDQA
jgi:chromosome condensin MukBEF MukE localization factor